MSYRRVQVATAAVFVVGWGCIGVVQPPWPDEVAIAVCVVPGFVAGFVIGEWWAVALAPAASLGLIVGYALNPCVPGNGVECDLNVPVLVLAFLMPPAAVLLVMGAGARRGLEILRG